MLEKADSAESVCHGWAFLATASAAQTQSEPAEVSDKFPFTGPEGSLAPYLHYLEVDS